MRSLDPSQPLFRSRLDAGEDLYFKHPMGLREPDDLLLIVASDGAVEVAWPWAYLCDLPVLRVDPGGLDGVVPFATGRPVALVDDGMLAADGWAAILRAVLAAAPRSVTLVAPTLRSPARRAARAAGVGRLCTLRPSTQADLAPSLYGQRPARPAVARGLLDQVRWDRRRVRQPEPEQEPLLQVVGL